MAIERQFLIVYGDSRFYSNPLLTLFYNFPY